MPYYPPRDSEAVPYDNNTWQEKAVADYARISLLQVCELDVFTFWALLHDVIVYNRSQTKKGREWLQNAYRLTQKEPDTGKLRRKLGKGG